LGKKHFFYEFRKDVRHFFGAILWFVRPSVPCCFAAGRCFSCSSVGMLLNALFKLFFRYLDLCLSFCPFGCWFLLSFLLYLWISQGTLGTFSVWLVRPSVAVLLPGSASGALCSECCLMLYPFFLEISVCLYLCSLAAAFWLCLAVFGCVSSDFMDFRRGVRQVFGAILWFVRPSVPCCFAGGRCFWCSSVGMLLNAFIQFLFKSRSSSLSLSFWLLLFGLVFLVSMDFRRDVRHFCCREVLLVLFCRNVG
jgi:hypothetical protein